MTEKERLKIYAIKTKAGYFLTDRIEPDSWRSETELATRFFDGKAPRKTFHQDWVFVPERPLIVEKEVPPKTINERWERKGDENAEKLPKVITRKDFEKDSDGCSCGHLYNLTETDFYERKWDEVPAGREELEFELEIILEVTKVKEYKSWVYPIIKGHWARTPDAEVKEGDAIYGLIQKMSIPSIILPSTDCKLSAEQTMAIIRAYVKEYIDLDYAEISSDYSFSLTVRKRIRVAEKIPYTVEKGRGRRKRDVTQYQDLRKAVVLDISHDGKYGEAVKPFEGRDRDDLKRNIDKFLEDIIAKINEPLIECAKCKGAGVIVEKIKVGETAEKGA